MNVRRKLWCVGGSMALGMGIGFVNAFLGIGFWPWGLASLVPAVLIYLVWFDRVWPKPRNGGSR